MKTHSCCAWSVTTSRAAQHNTTHNRRASLVPEFKAFFESNLVGNGQSYPDKNTHFQSGKLVWDAAFMWRESRHSSLVSLRLSLSRLGCCWYACRILIFQQRQQLWPLASLFQLGCFSLCCVVKDRPNQTVPCPKELLLFYSSFSGPIATPHCANSCAPNSALTKRTQLELAAD